MGLAIQLAIGLPSLIAGYYLGKNPARLIYGGYRTLGQVVDLKKTSFKQGGSYTTGYLPIIEFDMDGNKPLWLALIVLAIRSIFSSTKRIQKLPCRTIRL